MEKQTPSNKEKPERGSRYVIISPCRNESATIGTTIRTVLAQTLRPSLWVIVDDGSTDGTPEILREAEQLHPFIRIHRRQDRGRRNVGPGVVEAFYDGLETFEINDFDFICKLDCDLELPPRYFETLIHEMDSDPALGTASGKVYLRSKKGRLYHERRGVENSVGPAKFYRVACFREIGGFVKVVGWDTIDGHLCRLRGWIAKSFANPELQIVHLRQTGSSDRSVLRGRFRLGAGKWILGSSPPYVLAVTINRLVDRPYVIGSLVTLVGYMKAMLVRKPSFGDAAYRKYMRSFELEVLLRGKRRTLERRNREIRKKWAAR